jgi:hypothetical protein
VVLSCEFLVVSRGENRISGVYRDTPLTNVTRQGFTIHLCQLMSR